MNDKFPDKFVRVEAGWEKKEATLEEVVRMQWNMEMIAEYGSVSLIGYRLVFFRSGEKRGYYNGNEWTDDLQYNRTAHFSVLLWPKEKRTYEWAYASPRYYGMTEPGKWSYQIELAFQFKDENKIRVERSNRASIEIIDDFEDTTFSFDEIENAIIHELGHPDPLVLKRNVEMGSEGIIDLIVHGKSTLWVFEIKHKVSKGTISSLRKAVNWVEANYSRGHETVKGAIIITGKGFPEDKSVSYDDFTFYRLQKKGKKQATLISL